MSCERYLDLISARLDGELAQQEEAQLNAHLCECPACRAIAEGLAGLHTAFAHTGEVDAPAELSAGVMARIKEEKQRTRRRFARQLTGLAACLVLCVGVLRVVDATHSEYNRQRNNPTPLALIDEEPVSHDFTNEQYLPVTWGSTPAAPAAQIIGKTQSLVEFLDQFPQNDLSHLVEAYGPDFFSSRRLLAVVLEEPSSSIRHQIAPQGLFSDSVTVMRTISETGDCAMAAWLIVAEVDDNFSDGEVLAIAFSE